MSVGMIVLTAAAILVYFGAAQRVLDKLHLTDRGALVLIAIMFFGTLLPNISIGKVSVNIGGAVIPAGICLYLLVKAGSAHERLRAVIGSAITAASVVLLSSLLPDEPEAILIDPMYVNGIAGGVISYLLGRSRRGAFICGVLGVLLADAAVAVVNWINAINQPLVLGGAGLFDAAMLSGILAVLLCELVGEVLERFMRGPDRKQADFTRNPLKNKE